MTAAILRKARESAAVKEEFFAFTGKDGGRFPALADHCFVVPSFSIHRIQETHVALYHIVRDLVHVALGEDDVV
jgi:D-sedoheptulose 7-phosphate isomerase